MWVAGDVQRTSRNCTKTPVRWYYVLDSSILLRCQELAERSSSTSHPSEIDVHRLCWYQFSPKISVQNRDFEFLHRVQNCFIENIISCGAPLMCRCTCHRCTNEDAIMCYFAYRRYHIYIYIESDDAVLDWWNIVGMWVYMSTIGL